MPSPLVMVINSNLFQNESGDGTSQSLDAVAEEVMAIVEGIYFYLLKISLCWSGSINNTPSYIVQYNHMLLKAASAIRKKQAEFKIQLLKKKITA